MLLLARVRRTVIERGLIARGAVVVVGVSGGPDSMALLDVLARLASELVLRLVACGVDHGLRAAAAAELDVAQARAHALAVPFERVLLAQPADHSSVHAWARRERYAALHAIAARHGATRIAVGHTLDDQAETVIARVLRGSGLRGLAAIDPARADGVVRPLIDASRGDVRLYLADSGVAFAEDPSNEDPRFERSRVRQNVLPALAAETPNAAQHLAWLADEAREADALLDTLALRLLADAAVEGGISVSRLRDAPETLALRALRRAMGGDLGRAHLSALTSWLHARSGERELRLPDGHTARLEGDRITLTRTLGRDPDEEA